jgi:predicted aminopeptidase
LVRALPFLAFALGASGCHTVAFYSQAVSGHLRLMGAREPVAALLDDAGTEPALRSQLARIDAMLDFARDRLALPVGKRYRTFVAVTGESVVWNVYAADELAVEPHTWCYPVIGCAAYRGFFAERDAASEARRQRARGRDARVDGAAAYSTLGWFDDPLLSTFVGWPEGELAGLLFHELAHSRVFVRGDTDFNESYASFVERQGVAEWLGRHADAQDLAEWRARIARRDTQARLMLAWRDALAALYVTPVSPFAKRMMKADLLRAALDCARRIDHGAGVRLAPDLNNADFVPWTAYAGAVPAFRAIFEDHGGDWSAFHRAVDSLSDEGTEARLAALDAARSRGVQPERATIACEALVPESDAS